eukprot:gb/GECG01010184.1/.p1 GENE.gb/GECG01010184.1/~~gb/GECG01010184.1/.p1  ORF type:complete len:308 (+),score=47.18 gb/GECG01010184.1/:1-924(+)
MGNQMVASACLLLGGKIEDELVQTEKVAKAYLRYARPDIASYQDKDEKTSELVVETKDKINQLERQLLNVCEFDLDIQHPWHFFKNLLSHKEEEKAKYEPVKKKARLFSRDVLKEFSVCLRFDPLTIAKAAIAHGGESAEVPPPNVDVPQDLDKKSYLTLLRQKWCEYVDFPVADLDEWRSRVYRTPGKPAQTHATSSTTTNGTDSSRRPYSTEAVTNHRHESTVTVSSATASNTAAETSPVSGERSTATTSQTANGTHTTVESSMTAPTPSASTTDAATRNTEHAERVDTTVEDPPSQKRQRTDQL